MKYVELKGARVPALGFGTWMLTGRHCLDMVRLALEIGYRHIDTAQAYGNEAEVGDALAGSGVDRGEVFLTTKVWMDKLADGPLQRSVEGSLRKLRTDHVDLLLIHWPSRSVPLAQTLRALGQVRDDGRARHLGVSNFPVSLLREAVETHGADLLCDQVEYHPFLSQRPLLDALRSYGMMLTAYSPLARGEVARDRTLAEIGARHGKSPAQVALRWLIEQDGVAAIPKASNERHSRDNFDIFDFELSDDDRAVIDRLPKNRRRIDPGWAPQWDAA